MPRNQLLVLDDLQRVAQEDRGYTLARKMGPPGQGVIVLVTGPPGAGKSTVVRAACELIARRTQQQTIQLEFDDLIVGVIDPDAYLTARREHAGLEMTVTAALIGATYCGWLVLEGCFNRRRLDHLRARLPVAAIYGLSAPLDTCWERNEGRDGIIRLSKDEFDQLIGRLDVRPGDDLYNINWLDTTLPVDTLADQLASELIELAGTPVA